MSAKNRTPRQTRNERRAARPLPMLDVPALPPELRDKPVVRTESLGLRKMSDVLEEFVAPIVETFPPDAARETIERTFSVGMAVWNATLDIAPPGQLDEIIATLASGDDLATASAVVRVLVAQRKARFAHDQRVIVDVKMSWVRGEMRLVVASVVAKAK